MTTRLAGWVRGGGAGKASRGAAQPPHAPEAPAALAGVLASQLLARYQQCLAECAVLVRPESGARGEDWARLRRERAPLEAELLRRQQAHQAAGPGLWALYDFGPVMTPRGPLHGAQGPATPSAGAPKDRR